MADNWKRAFQEIDPSLNMDGDASQFRFNISHVHLNNGAKFSPRPDGVTVIVGGNNAGKSTVLSEIQKRLSETRFNPRQELKSLDSMDIELSDVADALAWFGSNYPYVRENNRSGFKTPRNDLIDERAILRSLKVTDDRIGELADFLILYGNALGRFDFSPSVGARDYITDPAVHPLHKLEDSPQLLDEVNQVSERIFNIRLTFDRLAGRRALRVGTMTQPAPLYDSIPREYYEEMARLPLLEEQGDGMQSLMGQIIPIVTSSYPVVLLDEPEAFLHPPQAHALGLEIGALSKTKRVQIIAATHDKNFLTGLLNSEVEVSVVRLARKHSVPVPSELPASDIRQIWDNPVLKYSNVLEGLFHQLVVLAEAEGDCSYLKAALDHEDRADIPASEVQFVPTHGKAGMPRIARALRAVGVSVVAAPDFDILRNESDLKSLVTAIGGVWTEELSQLWKRATNPLKAIHAEPSIGEVVDAIEKVFAGRRENSFSGAAKKELMQQIRTRESPWKDAKKRGLGALRGEAYDAARELLDRLEEMGIVVLRVGELESLSPRVDASNKDEWYRKALEMKEFANEDSQEHVARILSAGERVLEGASSNGT